MVYPTRASRSVILFASLFLHIKFTGASPLDIRDIGEDTDIVTGEDLTEIAADGTGPLRTGKSIQSNRLTTLLSS